MTDPGTDVVQDADTPSDAELISRVRGGDVAAFGELFARHRDAANRLARQLVRGPDSDDLVAEAFAKVLSVLQGGGGPDVAFRAYLLTAVRRLHIDRVRSGQRLQTTDDMTQFDPGVPFQDTAVAGFENGAAARAFASLPERWQLVLWHLEVERNKPADIAPLLGMSPNSVSALAYRAREGLRQAFLTMHLSDISETECRWVNEHLGAFVRKGLAKRDAAKVRSHLDGCRRCTAMYLELEDVNSNLAGIIGPLLLGSAAAGYLASVGTGATAVGSVGGITHLASRAKDIVVANTGAATAAGIAATVAAAAVVAVAVGALGGGDKPAVVADPGAGLSSSVPLDTDVPSVLGASPLTPTASPSASATPSLSPSASSSVAVTPGPTLSLLPSTKPTSPVFGPPSVPTTTSNGTGTGTGTGTGAGTGAGTGTGTGAGTGAGTGTNPGGGSTGRPTGRPSSRPSTTPTTTPPPGQAAGDPGPAVVADPVLVADGSVRVTARNLAAQDRLDVVLQSDETTFSADLGVPGCTRLAARHVSCASNAAARLGLERAVVVAGVTPRATSRVSVSLPLAFPASMVTDDVTATSTVGDVSATVHEAAFRPSRTPSYDFTAPVLTQTGHSVPSSTEDDFALSTPAKLPPHVAGLVYTVTGAGAGFVSGDGCTAAGRTLTCPDVGDGDLVTMIIGVPDLTAPATISVTAAPVDAFTDPVPDNATTSLTVDPGADLGLDLSVQSANPDRSARVTLAGQLTGVRPGMASLTYTLTGAATWPAAGNPGCTVGTDPAELTCLAPTDGPLSLVVTATNRNGTTPLAVSVAAGAPFQGVPLSMHSVDLTLPGRPVDDSSLTDLAVATQSVSRETDRYRLTGTVAGLSSDVGYVDLALSGGDAFATVQPDPDCGPSPEDPGVLRCTGAATGGRLSLDVDSTLATPHDLTVTLLATDPYDDPDPADNARTVHVAPGAALALTPTALGALHQDADGDYPVSTTVTGIRAGVHTVGFGLSDGLGFAATTTSGCSVTADRLTCTDLTAGDPVAFTVHSATPATATDLSLTATPGDGFVQVGGAATASARLVPSYDFSMGHLTETGHTLADGTDTFALSSTVAALPTDLDALSFALTGDGAFAATQDDGCTRTDDSHVRCTGLAAGGTVAFRVDSTATTTEATGIRLVTPDGYDDPQPADDAATATGLHPGVDLHLADLDPDNASPSNDDDQHLVATALTGVRPGLGAVTYTLTGNASFTRVSVAGCDVTARTVTCQDPADGAVDFTVTADDVRSATPIAISVEPSDPFVELADGDNADSATLAARPTYDFGLGALTRTAHTLSGDTDHYTLTSTVGAVPNGVPGLGFTVEGGTFAAGQDSGCTRVDDTTLSCTDLGADRAVDFHVDSTSTSAHDVRISLQVPRRYDDPDAADDSAVASVTPAVDLSLGELTPAAPVPAAGIYEVTGTLAGVRSGPVTLTVSGGATLTASSCTVTSSTVASCDDATDGQGVRLSLRSSQPLSSTTVTVHARAAAGFEELDDADNTATATLAPDVVLASLRQTADSSAYATVRATVSGIPAGAAVVRLQLTGAAAGLGTGQVHFTLGANGADGEGAVDCRTSDAGGTTRTDGIFVTCDHLATVADRSFAVDARLAHPHGTPTPVTFTVLPVGVDQGPHTGNDSRTLSVS